MARVATTKFDLGMWTDGENPGAGSQVVDNTGLNGNWQKLATAVKDHKTTGVHEDDVIDGPMLKTTSADGSTVELSGSPLKLRVSALGITTAEIANDAVDATKLKDDASVDANRAVTTNHVRDAAITAAKLATDVPVTAGRQIFGDQRVAGTAVGNTAASETIWQETAVTVIQKIRVFTWKDSRDKKCRVIAAAKTTAGTWTIQLRFGLSTQNVSGTNTTFGSSPEVDISMDISGLTDDDTNEVAVEMQSDNTANTVQMKQVSLSVLQV